MKDKSTLHLSGDFAKLCGINKSTLHYYVSIGLLQPALITDSNYKYYSSNQAYTIHLINILQKSGCSLSEIRAYLNGDSDLEQFKFMLVEQEQKLIQERNELNNTITMLHTVNHFTDFALNRDYDSPHEYYLPETIGILCTPFSKPTRLGDAEYTIGFKKHLKMCDEYPHAIKYPIGRIVKERNILMEDYNYSALFCFSSSAFETTTSLAKGNYVCCVNNGRSAHQVYTSLLTFIKQKQYTITGSAVELSISVPHSSPEQPDYIVLIFIPIA